MLSHPLSGKEGSFSTRPSGCSAPPTPHLSAPRHRQVKKGIDTPPIFQPRSRESGRSGRLFGTPNTHRLDIRTLQGVSIYSPLAVGVSMNHPFGGHWMYSSWVEGSWVLGTLHASFVVDVTQLRNGLGLLSWRQAGAAVVFPGWGPSRSSWGRCLVGLATTTICAWALGCERAANGFDQAV